MDLRGIVRAAGIAAAAVWALWLTGCSKNTASGTVSVTCDTLSGTYGTLVDTRDGNVYRTVKMPDGRVWMAGNLKYKIPSSKPRRRPKPRKGRHHDEMFYYAFAEPKAGTSRCVEGDEPNCDKYGRLYGWNAAAKACPAGWRLPTIQEWDILGQAVGGLREHNDHIGMTFWHGAGAKLKTKSGWKDCEGRVGNGTDDYGFSALPGPGGWSAAWWAATAEKSSPYGLTVRCHSDFMSGDSYYDDTYVQVIGPGPIPIGDGLSVRCVKDESEEEARQRKQLRVEAEQRRLEKLSTYFTDSRDGRKYRAVEIGGRNWMAENLNYRPQSGNFWCYNDSDSYCGKYGRLYDWETARVVCPTGWHLPSRREWDDLGRAVGGERRIEADDYSLTSVGAGWYGAGKTLKAKSGWDETAAGTDDYGFSAMPGGGRYIPYYARDNRFLGGDGSGLWWTSTEFDSGGAYARYMSGRDNVMYEPGYSKASGFPARCLQDEGEERELARKNEEQKQWEAEQRRLEKISTHFVDPRDGRSYRAVKIGGDTWMAENLNYQTDSSWCYDNDTSNCGKYGRLYTWETAMAACPAGWHLSSVKEWDNLSLAVGGEKKKEAILSYRYHWDDVGEKLKARSGWSAHNGKSGDGTDDYGFSAAPGGYGRRAYNSKSNAYKIGKFYLAGDLGKWWTATGAESKRNSDLIDIRSVYHNDGYVGEDFGRLSDVLSVRCVADAP